MHLFHIFYIIGAIAAIVAGFPQLRRLLQSKRSEEFSIPTWAIWLFSQITALAYALWIHDVLYTAVSAFWAVFYALMVVLIIKYRANTVSLKAFILKKRKWSRASNL